MPQCNFLTWDCSSVDCWPQGSATALCIKAYKLLLCDLWLPLPCSVCGDWLRALSSAMPVLGWAPPSSNSVLYCVPTCIYGVSVCGRGECVKQPKLMWSFWQRTAVYDEAIMGFLVQSSCILRFCLTCFLPFPVCTWLRDCGLSYNLMGGSPIKGQYMFYFTKLKSCDCLM